VAAIAVCGLAVLGVLLVAVSSGECVRRRTDIGEFSYYADMVGGANGNAVQANLMDRTKCPLGFSYNSDGSCPVHGALTRSEIQGVYKRTRGVYGQ
jgi:hypothetical protein